MRKRLRKKLGKGEFAVPVVPIVFRIAELPVLARNSLIDRFLEEAIYANGLQFGGGGGGSVQSGFAEPQKAPGSVSADQRAVIDAWLTSEPRVLEHFVGEAMSASEVDAAVKDEPDFPESRLYSV